MKALGAPNQSDVVITLSIETWDDLVRRQFARPPDRMVQHLRGSEQIGRLLVVNPWRSLPGHLQRLVTRRPDAPFPSGKDRHLFRPLRLRRADSASISRLERSYHAYGRSVRLAASARGLKNPALITFNPLFAAFGDHSGFRAVTYVGRDDWAAYHRHRHLWSTYQVAYERIRDRGLRVSAVSDVLLQRIAPQGPSRVTPNGVDPATWTTPGPPPSVLLGLDRPIAMYTGTIDERLSVPAFRSLADTLASGTVVLVGPQRADVAATLRAAAPNIVLLPSVGQVELAALVSAADVCVIPHVRSDLTQAMSPLKVYEYLAAGRPVVATDLPPLHGVHSSVVLVDDDDAFGRGAQVALAQGPLSEAARRTFIEGNSWDARCQSILDLALQS